MSKLPDHLHDVGPGWHPLLHQLHAELTEINPDYQVAQVKEKWGLLRVYIDGTPIQVDAVGPDGRVNFPIESSTDADNWHVIQGVVDRYEDMSGHICEFCGNPGTLDRTRWWLKTLCPACTGNREHILEAWLNAPFP